MSTAITKSGYGYWLDADAKVHPVTQAEEHSGVAHRLLGDAFEQALTLKWVRVSVYATDGLLYFEHDPKQPPSAHQMLALRELKTLHGLRIYDEVKQATVEASQGTDGRRCQGALGQGEVRINRQAQAEVERGWQGQHHRGHEGALGQGQCADL